MLPLYRRWFDSKPLTLIPSSLLLPTNLVNASSPPPFTPPPHPSFVKKHLRTFWVQLFNSLLRFLSPAYINTHKLCESTNSARMTWFTASAYLCVHWFSWSVCVCGEREFEKWSILKARECLSALSVKCLPQALGCSSDLLSSEGINSPRLTAPLTLSGGRALVTGCCSLVPGCLGGSFKGILLPLSSRMETVLEDWRKRGKERVGGRGLGRLGGGHNVFFF